MKIRQFDPYLGEEEIVKVLETLKDNWLTEGPKTAELEKRLREYTGARHVLMMPNGTLALFAALKVLGLGPGDEVLVPDFTFFGSASAVILTGARPVFVDVSPDDFNIDVASARHCISDATRAIMPVHIFGQTCDMERVMSFAGEYGLKVVEDAAQGMGVRCGGRHVGTFGDIGCISFFADKTITTGEGGALLVNDDELAERCMYFKNQGRLHRGSFIHTHVGYNFRITDVQAAIGVAQMGRLDYIIERKHKMLQLYQELLGDCGGASFPRHNGLGEFVPFRINILLDDPEALQDFLEHQGVAARRFFYPLHLQPSLNRTNSVIRKQPVHSLTAFKSGLSLPSGINLSHDEIAHVCKCIHEFAVSGERV